MVQQAKRETKKKFSYLRLIMNALLFATIVIELINSIPDSFTPIERLELSARDIAFRLRGAQEPENPIVIVAIDDSSFNYTGYRWPWPREFFAQIVNVLNESGAAVIGLDVFLFEPDSDPSGDEKLIEAFRSSAAVASVMHLEVSGSSETLSLPLLEYREVLDATGITGILFDDDAIVRSITPYQYSSYQDGYIYNWAFEIARLYRGGEPASISTNRMVFDGQPVSLSRGRMLVNYAGPAGTFPYYPAFQVALGDFPPETFKDKIVMIGATTVTLQDSYPTPFSSVARTPGVEIVSNAVNTILTGDYIHIAPPLVNILIILLAGLCAFFIQRNKQVMRALVILIVAMLLVVVIWYVLFAQSQYFFGLVLPEASLFFGTSIPIMQQVVTQELEKRRIRRLFSSFVSPEMVSQLIETPDISKLNKRAELTILFSDIRGFTTLSEKLSPEGVVNLLNPYLEAMTKVVHKHGGTVDKYEGDAIVAFFGEPIPHKDHAVRAVFAACEMFQVLDELRDTWHREGRFSERFQIGVGINTGEVFVGMLGSSLRVNYTVIGDAANLAARLQDQTKELHWPILISESTYEKVKSDMNAFFITSTLLKGKTAPTRIYGVLGSGTFVITGYE